MNHENFFMDILVKHKNGAIITSISTRQEYDDFLSIEPNKDSDQYIKIGDVITVDENRYSVVNMSFVLSKYWENKQDHPNCHILIFVETQI